MSKLFGAQLARWRTAANLPQAALDSALEKSRGHVAQIETGRLIPPGPKECLALAEALGITFEEVWSCSAPERLRRLDPDLVVWVQSQLNGDVANVLADNQRLRERVYELERALDALRSAVRKAIGDTP